MAPRRLIHHDFHRTHRVEGSMVVRLDPVVKRRVFCLRDNAFEPRQIFQIQLWLVNPQLATLAAEMPENAPIPKGILLGIDEMQELGDSRERVAHAPLQDLQFSAFQAPSLQCFVQALQYFCLAAQIQIDEGGHPAIHEMAGDDQMMTLDFALPPDGLKVFQELWVCPQKRIGIRFGSGGASIEDEMLSIPLELAKV